MTQFARYQVRPILFCLAALLLLNAQAGDPPAEGDSRVVASFPGWELTAAELREKIRGMKMLERFDGAELDARALDHVRANAYLAWRDSLDGAELRDPWLAAAELINLRQDLGRLNILYSRKPLAEQDAPSEEAIRAAFDERRQTYGRDALVTFRYIMIRGLEPERRELSENVASQLREHPETFGELAEQFSQSTLTPKSGLVGPTSEKGLLPAMADVLFRQLGPGESSGPIELPSGYAILLLESRSEPFLPEWNDEWRSRVLVTLEREFRAAALKAEIERLTAPDANMYELLMAAFPGPDADGELPALRWNGETTRFGVAKAFLVEQLIFPTDEKSWARAMESLRDLLAQRTALVALVGETEAGMNGEQDRARARRDQRHMAEMHAALPPTEEERGRALEWMLAELRKTSHFAGRVVYLRPAQKPENAGRKVVPMADVLAEANGLLEDLRAGELSFDDAIQANSTDEASKAKGGAVSTLDADVAAPIAKALRDRSIGTLGEPVRLDDGFALIIVDEELRAYPTERDQLLWMADLQLPSALRRERTEAHQKWFEANLLKTNDALIGEVAREARAIQLEALAALESTEVELPAEVPASEDSAPGTK